SRVLYPIELPVQRGTCKVWLHLSFASIPHLKPEMRQVCDNPVMKIAIIGAGDLGLAVAKLLSEERHSLTLVDEQVSALQRAAEELDVATSHGSGTESKILQEIADSGCELFLALTGHDATNFAACALIKRLRPCQTVARVGKIETSLEEAGAVFSIDHFV